MRAENPPSSHSALLLATACSGVLLAGVVGLRAQPKITALSPDWIQRGTTLEVNFTGEGLGSVTGFVFSGESGLSAVTVVESNPPPSVTVESASKGIAAQPTSARDRTKSLRARITAASDAPLGIREEIGRAHV